MKEIKTAFFGCAHPHASTLYRVTRESHRFLPLGYADVPVFDQQEPEERKRNLGCGAEEMKCFDNWEQLLDQKPDLAIVASDNKSKHAISMTLLSLGIPVILEKPMAATYQDALDMAACAEKHNTKVITNWPVSWFLAFRKAKELAAAGEIGQIRRVVYRSPATWGPYSYSPDGKLPPSDWLKKTWWYQKELGGGSILDYACYGVMLSTWMFGHQAISVSAVSKQFDTQFSDVEDYSAMILDFGEGVGLLEGSWSSYNPAEIPTGPVLYGSDGVIVCDRHSTLVKVYHGNSHVQTAPAKILDTEKTIASDMLAENILRYMDGIGELDETIDMPLNLQIMAALSAGTEAIRCGLSVKTRNAVEELDLIGKSGQR